MAPAAAAAAAAAVTDNNDGAVRLSSQIVSKLSDELQCCVCLDIQVQPRTIDPCGHSFCASCLKDLKNCPQCRKKIKSHVPAMQLDSLIQMLVSVPSLLDKGDVEHYHQRKRGQKLTPAVYHKKRSSKRRRTQRTPIGQDMYGVQNVTESEILDLLREDVPPSPLASFVQVNAPINHANSLDGRYILETSRAQRNGGRANISPRRQAAGSYNLPVRVGLAFQPPLPPVQRTQESLPQDNRAGTSSANAISIE